jgi:hypothetical protein
VSQPRVPRAPVKANRHLFDAIEYARPKAGLICARSSMPTPPALENSTSSDAWDCGRGLPQRAISSVEASGIGCCGPRRRTALLEAVRVRRADHAAFVLKAIRNITVVLLTKSVNRRTFA